MRAKWNVTRIKKYWYRCRPAGALPTREASYPLPHLGTPCNSNPHANQFPNDIDSLPKSLQSTLLQSWHQPNPLMLYYYPWSVYLFYSQQLRHFGVAWFLQAHIPNLQDLCRYSGTVFAGGVQDSYQIYGIIIAYPSVNVYTTRALIYTAWLRHGGVRSCSWGSTCALGLACFVQVQFVYRLSGTRIAHVRVCENILLYRPDAFKCPLRRWDKAGVCWGWDRG